MGPGPKDLIYNLMGWNDPRHREVMTTDRMKEKILRIIIDGNLAFSLAENPEFVDLLKDAYPDCPPPTRKTIVEYLKSKATLTKLELKEVFSQLDSKVSLALDAWTTRTNLAFLGMYVPLLRSRHMYVTGNQIVEPPILHIPLQC